MEGFLCVWTTVPLLLQCADSMSTESSLFKDEKDGDKQEGQLWLAGRAAPIEHYRVYCRLDRTMFV